MADADLPRALEMLWATALARAAGTVAVPGGTAVLDADLPGAHDHNRLLVREPCDPQALAAAADEVLGGAGLRHRLVQVLDEDLGARLTEALVPRGWAAAPELLMAVTGEPERRGGDVPVVRLDLAERVAAARGDWRRDQPAWDDDLVDQLSRRIATVQRALDPVFLGVRDRAGAVVARADLYLRDGVAQVEEVMTAPAAQGRGLASALVLHAVRRARLVGADLVFLLADGDGWPQHLYRRLGFSDLGRTVSLSREAS